MGVGVGGFPGGAAERPTAAGQRSGGAGDAGVDLSTVSGGGRETTGGRRGKGRVSGVKPVEGSGKRMNRQKIGQLSILLQLAEDISFQNFRRVILKCIEHRPDFF